MAAYSPERKQETSLSQLPLLQYLTMEGAEVQIPEGDEPGVAIPRSVYQTFSGDFTTFSNIQVADVRHPGFTVGFLPGSERSLEDFLTRQLIPKLTIMPRRTRIDHQEEWTKLVVVVFVCYQDEVLLVPRIGTDILSGVATLSVMESVISDDFIALFGLDLSQPSFPDPVRLSPGVSCHRFPCFADYDWSVDSRQEAYDRVKQQQADRIRRTVPDLASAPVSIRRFAKRSVKEECPFLPWDRVDFTGLVGSRKGDFGLVYGLQCQDRQQLLRISRKTGGLIFDVYKFGYSEVAKYHQLSPDGWSEAILRFIQGQRMTARISC